MNARKHFWNTGLAGSLLGIVMVGCGEEAPTAQTQAEERVVATEGGQTAPAAGMSPASHSEPAKPKVNSPSGVILPDPEDESGKNEGPKLPKIQ